MQTIATPMLTQQNNRLLFSSTSFAHFV